MLNKQIFRLCVVYNVNASTAWDQSYMYYIKLNLTRKNNQNKGLWKSSSREWPARHFSWAESAVSEIKGFTSRVSNIIVMQLRVIIFISCNFSGLRVIGKSIIDKINYFCITIVHYIEFFILYKLVCRHFSNSSNSFFSIRKIQKMYENVYEQSNITVTGNWIR